MVSVLLTHLSTIKPHLWSSHPLHLWAHYCPPGPESGSENTHYLTVCENRSYSGSFFPPMRPQGATISPFNTGKQTTPSYTEARFVLKQCFSVHKRKGLKDEWWANWLHGQNSCLVNFPASSKVTKIFCGSNPGLSRTQWDSPRQGRLRPTV